MKTSVRSAILAAAIIAGSLPAMAQSNQSSGSASDQFKSAGQHISQGAQNVGEGIKQGAIQFWDALKAGAQTVGNKLSGHSEAPKASNGNGQ